MHMDPEQLRAVAAAVWSAWVRAVWWVGDHGAGGIGVLAAIFLAWAAIAYLRGGVEVGDEEVDPLLHDYDEAARWEEE